MAATQYCYNNEPVPNANAATPAACVLSCQGYMTTLGIAYMAYKNLTFVHEASSGRCECSETCGTIKTGYTGVTFTRYT